MMQWTKKILYYEHTKKLTFDLNLRLQTCSKGPKNGAWHISLSYYKYVHMKFQSD